MGDDDSYQVVAETHVFPGRQLGERGPRAGLERLLSLQAWVCWGGVSGV